MLNRVRADAIENNSFKTGELLVNEGFIRKADLQRAIELQQKETRSADLPLGKLMVKKKLIDRKQLQSLLQHIEILRELETFAVESGRIGAHDLAKCVEKKPPGMPLAEFLVTNGSLTKDDLKVFFEKQLDSLKICELAVETGMVSEQQLHAVLHSQHTPRTIGEILCELNLITPLDLNAVLTKYRKHLQLGEILQRNGLIDKRALDWALKEHGAKGEALGSILMRKDILTEEQLFSAFSLQYNLPFENLEGFEYGPVQKETLTQIVEKTFSDRFHIVPLSLEESTLTVAVSDPADLELANSLRAKRLDLRTRCVLVTPSTRKRLQADLYDRSPDATVPEESAPGKSVPAAPRNASTRVVLQASMSPPPPDRSSTEKKPVEKHLRGDVASTDVYQTVFSAPEIAKSDAQRLHHAYEMLMEKSGRRRHRSGFEIFEKFIRKHYSAIRRKYRCSSVTFCVIHQSEKVVLFATPNT